MGETGRRPKPATGRQLYDGRLRLERRNYRERRNLLKEHFDGVKVTDIDFPALAA